MVGTITATFCWSINNQVTHPLNELGMLVASIYYRRLGPTK
jgi:hypothetical protein